MANNIPINDWLFAVEEAPVEVLVTRGGKTRHVRIPDKKALVAADNGHVLAVVSAAYQVITNQAAIDLGRRFCEQAFEGTTSAEWEVGLATGPMTRSFAALDLKHKSHVMNFWDNETGPSDIYTPFVRVINSYNRSRALRFDLGFMRKHCSNGVVFEQKVSTVRVVHSREGIRNLDFTLPLVSFAETKEAFMNCLRCVRQIPAKKETAIEVLRLLLGWPKAQPKAEQWEITEIGQLDASLTARYDRYANELGANAYAVFNVMTDVAARPPESRRYRRDRPTVERIAGQWLKQIKEEAKEGHFDLDTHLHSLRATEGTERAQRQ